MTSHLDYGNLPRRRFLQMGLLSVGAAAAANMTSQPLAAQEGKPAAEGYIDAHVHVWTPDVTKYPLAPGRKVEEMQPPSFTPEELFANARPCGVSRITLIQMSFYGFDNSYMLDSIKRFPGVFAGVAVIDEENKPADTMRSLKPQKVRGFRIAPGKRPVATWLNGPGMAAMWRCGAEEGMAMCHLINPDSLPHVDRMCEKYPDTPVVIDHFARIGVDGVIRDSDLDALCKLARHKKTAVKVSAFYALGKKKAPYTDLGPMIRRLLDAFGPERLMWATDCPYQVQAGHTYENSIALIRDRLDFLSEGDRQWLLKKTAERIFFS
jgi:predicted TIM-barrel fold metal-dependent hydrolase